MKISELIEKLQEAQNQHGDADIFVHTFDDGGLEVEDANFSGEIVYRGLTYKDGMNDRTWFELILTGEVQ